MKAISVAFKGPTNYKPARWYAKDSDGNRFISSAGSNEAVRGLCRKMGWHGRMYAGHIKGSEVYVFEFGEAIEV